MSNYYLFAETAFIHQGDTNYLKQLIDQVALGPAKGIKFQVLTNASDFLSTHHQSFKVLSSYCFSKEQWQYILGYTSEKGLDIIMMPLNTEALTLCNEFSIKYLEIHTVSQNDRKLKEAVKATGIDLVITTGGRLQNEIENDILFFGEQVKVLMVGFQAFPSKLEDVRLGQISLWKERYPNVKIGYADHSVYDAPHAVNSLEYAYLLGASVFEKHVAVKAGEERVDFSAAVSTNTLFEINDRLAYLSKYINPVKFTDADMPAVEVNYRNRQLICVAARDLNKGSVLTESDICLKMYHDDTHTFDTVEKIVGSTLSKPLKADHPFQTDHF